MRKRESLEFLDNPLRGAVEDILAFPRVAVHVDIHAGEGFAHPGQDETRRFAERVGDAAVAAFEGPQDFLLEWRARFQKRRDMVVAAINAIPGLSTPVPDGAFYCMVDAAPLMSLFKDDEALALQLLDHGVAIVAASAFGGGDGFRISFAADETKLEEAMRRIAAAVA